MQTLNVVKGEEGVGVNGNGYEPNARVVVTAQREGDPAEVWKARTGATGTFSFSKGPLDRGAWKFTCGDATAELTV